MNLITGIILLFVSALIWGSVDQSSVIGSVPEGYPIAESGIEAGDRILSIDGKKVSNWDEVILVLNLKHKSEEYVFNVQKKDGKIKNYIVVPKVVNEDGKETKVFGVGQDQTKHRGVLASLKYAFTKTWAIISSMGKIIGSLFTGQLSLGALSGPVGVYSIVGEAAKTSAESVIYLMAYLSLNLAFINILPFPAFDGGRVLFLLLEKFRGKKINPKIENAVNNIGFILLMILMAIITFKDILNLF